MQVVFFIGEQWLQLMKRRVGEYWETLMSDNAIVGLSSDLDLDAGLLASFFELPAVILSSDRYVQYKGWIAAMASQKDLPETWLQQNRTEAFHVMVEAEMPAFTIPVASRNAHDLSNLHVVLDSASFLGIKGRQKALADTQSLDEKEESDGKRSKRKHDFDGLRSAVRFFYGRCASFCVLLLGEHWPLILEDPIIAQMLDDRIETHLIVSDTPGKDKHLMRRSKRILDEFDNLCQATGKNVPRAVACRDDCEVSHICLVSQLAVATDGQGCYRSPRTGQIGFVYAPPGLG